jgi:hypothetical protein
VWKHSSHFLFSLLAAKKKPTIKALAADGSAKFFVRDGLCISVKKRKGAGNYFPYRLTDESIKKKNQSFNRGRLAARPSRHPAAFGRGN